MQTVALILFLVIPILWCIGKMSAVEEELKHKYSANTAG